MTRSMFLLFAIGLFLAILSSSADAQDEGAGEDDLSVVNTDVDNDIVDEESFSDGADYILLDDTEFDQDDQNYGDEDQNVGEGDTDDDTLDVRSVNSDNLLSLSDDVLTDELEKRDWTYKCEAKECNARCLALLNLPQGTCGIRGKCYCKRDK